MEEGRGGMGKGKREKGTRRKDKGGRVAHIPVPSRVLNNINIDPL